MLSLPLLTHVLDLFIFNVYECFGYTYVCLPHASLVPTEVRRECQTPGTRVADGCGCESLCRRWELNPGPLEDLFKPPELLKFSGTLFNPFPHQFQSLQPPVSLLTCVSVDVCGLPTLVSPALTDFYVQPLPQAAQFLPQPSLVPSCLALLPSS